MPFSFYAFCLGEVFTDINGKATDQVTIYIPDFACFFCENPTFWILLVRLVHFWEMSDSGQPASKTEAQPHRLLANNEGCKLC